MSFGTPVRSTQADYRGFFTSPDGVTVHVSVPIVPSQGITEAERDAAAQAAIDAVAALPGWTFNGGSKSYQTSEEIAVTP